MELTDRIEERKAAARRRSAAWRAANPSRARESEKRSRNPIAKRAYDLAYYEANKDRLKAASAERSQRLKVELRPYNVERVQRRNARKLQATPAWANVPAMQMVYLEAERLTRETGVEHEVDHIVPLQSKLVCGLHVQHNLQAIPRGMNRSKGNRFWPDMP